MKNLNLSYNGGHRLRIDDINHLQSGIKDSLKALGLTFSNGNDPIILYGAKITESLGNSYVSQGVLLIDGELMIVNAAMIAGALDTDIEYQVLEDYLAPSPVQYEDLNNRNVHRHRYVVLGRDSARPGNFVAGYYPANTKRIDDNWVTPGLGANWVQKDTNAEGGDLQYNIDYFRRKVEFRGCVHYVDGAVPGSAVLFTLPVGMRPPSRQMRPIFSSTNMSGVDFDLNAFTYCIVDTNGDVSVDINLGHTKAYRFDGVYIYL